MALVSHLFVLLLVLLQVRPVQAAPRRAWGAGEGGGRGSPASRLEVDLEPLADAGDPGDGFPDSWPLPILEPRSKPSEVPVERTFPAPRLDALPRPGQHHRGSPRTRHMADGEQDKSEDLLKLLQRLEIQLGVVSKRAARVENLQKTTSGHNLQKTTTVANPKKTTSFSPSQDMTIHIAIDAAVFLVIILVFGLAVSRFVNCCQRSENQSPSGAADDQLESVICHSQSVEGGKEMVEETGAAPLENLSWEMLLGIEQEGVPEDGADRVQSPADAQSSA